MDGFGTDDDALIRCLVLCGKRRIPYVAAKYEELFGSSLEDAIGSETSGDYKKAMQKFLKPAKKGSLGSPLKAFQEISIDAIDADGDMAEGLGEGPVSDMVYFIFSGDHEYREKFKFALKEGTENTFYLTDSNDQYLSAQPPASLQHVSNPDIWEEFTVEPHPDDPTKYAFRTYHNSYVMCNEEGEWSFDGSTPGEFHQLELRDDLFS